MHGVATTRMTQGLLDRIEDRIREVEPGVLEGGRLAQAVLRLSDYYLTHPDAKTPYEEKWARLASLGWFLPLNTIRNQGVASHGLALGFFDGLKSARDIGSGLGAMSHACEGVGLKHLRWQCFERSNWAAEMHRKLSEGPVEWVVADAQKNLGGHEPRDLISFSYSLTEFDRLPTYVRDHQAVLIVEPGTKLDGRRLFEFRSQLLSWGFHIWGPCTHQVDCPMQIHSKTDWCHDRISWEPPSWFGNILRHVPMDGKTLPFAYLMARRDPPPSQLRGLARLTGDVLKEKGRDRQLICRGAAREFGVWQTKSGGSPGFARGSLVSIRANVPTAGDGLRLGPEDCVLAPL